MWQALLEKHGFEVVETCKKLVLAKIVETHCSWLASSQGEGLVLNVGGQLAKLKSAGEAQHSTPGRLASCMKTAKLCVQETLVLQTLETMIGFASTYVPCVLQGMSFDGRQTCKILPAHFSESSCSGPLRNQATLRSLVMLLIRPRQSTTTYMTFFTKVRRVLLAKKFFCFVVGKTCWAQTYFFLRTC